MRLSTIVLVLLVVTMGAGGASSAASGPEKKKFDTIYNQWRELLITLRTMRNEYQFAPPSKRAQMQAEYGKLVAKGHQLSTGLVAAAEKAYVENPKDKALVDFILANIRDSLASDRYEPAARECKLLLDNGFQNPDIYSPAGLAFFALHDFQKANEYLLAGARVSQLDRATINLQREALPYVDYWKAEQAIRAKEAKANDLPRVKLETTKGDIELELFENEAPIDTANFISLTEKNFYDGLKFHRVIPNFMAQGGDNEKGGPGYMIPDECYQANARMHFRGSLSMAKTEQRDSGNSQFFLTFLPTPHLNGKHTVFGRVVSGWEVLSELNRVQEGQGGTPDRIKRATVLRKRDHKYEPTKIPARQ